MIWVYIAGPYKSPDPIRNMRVAMQTWFKLKCLGFHPVCPHWTGFQDFLTPMPRGDWLGYDQEMLSRCDVLFRLRGLSSGADEEVRLAERRGIPVVCSIDELLSLHPDRTFRSPAPVESGKE